MPTAPENLAEMTTLKVDNLSKDITNDDLKDIFEKYGDIGDIYIPRAHPTMEPRGFAFVRFVNKQDAEDATRACDGKEVMGREIGVREAAGKSKSKDFYQSRPRRNDNRGYGDRDSRRYDDRDSRRYDYRDSRRYDDRDSRRYDDRDSRRYDDRDNRRYDDRDSRRYDDRDSRPALVSRSRSRS